MQADKEHSVGQNLQNAEFNLEDPNKKQLKNHPNDLKFSKIRNQLASHDMEGRLELQIFAVLRNRLESDLRMGKN
jgi:hypothetical protein